MTLTIGGAALGQKPRRLLRHCLRPSAADEAARLGACSSEARVVGAGFGGKIFEASPYIVGIA
jgi:hypothetical protein